MSDKSERLTFEFDGLRLNLVVSTIPNAKWLNLLSFFGVGIIFWPIRKSWMQTKVSREAHQGEIQREFDHLVSQIARVRRLDIATLIPLKLQSLENLTNLRTLNIVGPVLDEPNFNKLTKLTHLSGRHPSIQRIEGLNELSQLTYVEVPFPKKQFLEKLPTNLIKLCLQCKVPKNLDVSHLSSLQILSLDSVPELDFNNFSKPLLHLEELELSEIGNIRNIRNMMVIFPNVQIIKSKLTAALNTEIGLAIPNKVKIRVPILWRLARP
jgi:hypothetical protein